MNSFEIYRLWTVFSQMVEDSSLSVDAKIRVGREMLSSLPPELLCTSSKSSREVVSESIKGRLSDLEDEYRRTRLRTAPALQGQTTASLLPGASAVASSQDSQERHGEAGVSVEGVVASGQPKTAKPKVRHAKGTASQLQ